LAGEGDARVRRTRGRRSTKRYFTAAELGGELGGGKVLFDGRRFAVVAG
jgi:hypothetical protein